MNVYSDRASRSDWLEDYLTAAVRRNLCVGIHCTTCGATDFRRGILAEAATALGHVGPLQWTRPIALEIVRSLSLVRPISERLTGAQMEAAVRCVLYDIC